MWRKFKDLLDVNATKIKSKRSAMQIESLALLTTGTLREMQERITTHKKRMMNKYKEEDFSPNSTSGGSVKINSQSSCQSV